MKQERSTRVILTEHERDLFRCIEHVRSELRINALINEELQQPLYDMGRVFDLMNLKEMLLAGLLERSMK